MGCVGARRCQLHCQIKACEVRRGARAATPDREAVCARSRSNHPRCRAAHESARHIRGSRGAHRRIGRSPWRRARGSGALLCALHGTVERRRKHADPDTRLALATTLHPDWRPRCPSYVLCTRTSRTDPAPRRTAGSAELLPPKAAGATAWSLLPGPLTAPYPGDLKGNKR